MKSLQNVTKLDIQQTPKDVTQKSKQTFQTLTYIFLIETLT